MGKVNFAEFQKDQPKKVVPKQSIQVKPKPKPKITHKEIDLRDEIDMFLKWIKQVNPQEFTGKREAVIKRIQSYNRPSLIEGTIELLTKYLKEKNFTVIH